MSSSHVQTPAARKAASQQQATLDALAGIVRGHVKDGLAPMAERLGAALADLGGHDSDAREVYRRVKSARLLKENAYAFVHLAADAIERALAQELARCAPRQPPADVPAAALSLVPLEEIDGRLALGALARPFDIAHAEVIATLSVRLGILLERGMLRADSNPFRPAVLLGALIDAWRAFEPEAAAHDLIQPLLVPDIVFDFGPLFEALVAALRQGGQPGSVEARRIQKTDDAAAARAAQAGRRARLAGQLRALFGEDGDDVVPLIPDLPQLPATGGAGGWRPSGAAGFVVPAAVPVAVPVAVPPPLSNAAVAAAAPEPVVLMQAAPGFMRAGQAAAAAQPMAGFAAAPHGAVAALTAGGWPAVSSVTSSAASSAALSAASSAGSPVIASDISSASSSASLPAALSAILARHGGMAPLVELLAGIEPDPAQAVHGDAAAPSVAATPPANVFYLPRLKQSLPQGSLPRADARTLDLLARVFETVLLDDSIPPRARALLQALQVPVLKAALGDKSFFFEEAHPARRLVDLLSRMGWGLEAEGRHAADDPLFQAMQRSVAGVAASGTAGPGRFAAAVAELEAGMAAQERAQDAALAAPVASALRQEQVEVAGRAARDAVALRVGAGDVPEVLGGFLEARWTTVLTFAFTIDQERPGAVANATRAMDDLIWSVKPKATQEGRKTLIGRLPRLLSTLNKWLDAIKWQDAERLQFFARLAECHASIVRAPIELAPERQLELAVEAAQRDALRRVELENAAAARAAEQEAQRAAELFAVDGLERGMWLEFRGAGGARKVKLAWVSPLRTLFIFSGAARREAFSMAADKLAAALHGGSARVLAIDGVVGQVLSEVLGQAAGNDAAADARMALH
jgi:hypothetical protein